MNDKQEKSLKKISEDIDLLKNNMKLFLERQKKILEILENLELKKWMKKRD